MSRPSHFHPSQVLLPCGCADCSHLYSPKFQTLLIFGSRQNTSCMPQSSDTKRFGFLLERTFRITKLSFIKAFNKLGVDITPDQWVLLDKLNDQGEMSQREISELSFKNAATVSRIIDKLVKKELVSRVSETDDRRKTTINLTDKGKNLVDSCLAEIEKLRALSWNELTEEDFEHFQRIANQVFKNFESYK